MILNLLPSTFSCLHQTKSSLPHATINERLTNHWMEIQESRLYKSLVQWENKPKQLNYSHYIVLEMH